MNKQTKSTVKKTLLAKRAFVKKKAARKSASSVKVAAIKKPADAKVSVGSIGSSFEGFLKDEGVYDEIASIALKRAIAWQIESAMTSQGMTKATMASRMKTSRSQLDRLLDPDNDKMQLDTLCRAASVIGKRLMISLETLR